MVGKHRPDIADTDIAAAYLRGASAKECAVLFGLSEATVHRRLRREGVPKKPTARRGRTDGKTWAQANPEKVRASQVRFRNKPGSKEYFARYYREGRDRILANRKTRYQLNRHQELELGKVARRRLREKDEADYKEGKARYMRAKRKSDLKFALNSRMSSQIFRCLRGGKAGRSWRGLVDYSVDELIDRLGETMPEGYDWSHVLSGDLHIDHKIPKSAFNYTRSEDYDFKRCWSLSNLQLLPALENIKKSDKLDQPFQPSLL